MGFSLPHLISEDWEVLLTGFKLQLSLSSLVELEARWVSMSTAVAVAPSVL